MDDAPRIAARGERSAAGPDRASGGDERRVPAADGRAPELVVVAGHRAATDHVGAGAGLVRRRIRQLPGRVARRPVAARVLHGRAVSARGAGARRTRHRREPVAGASGARGGSSAAEASKARRRTPACSWWRTCTTPEVWFDIEDRLVRIPEPYDLVVSLVEGRAELLEPEISERLPRAMIHPRREFRS